MPQLIHTTEYACASPGTSSTVPGEIDTSLDATIPECSGGSVAEALPHDVASAANGLAVGNGEQAPMAMQQDLSEDRGG